MLLSIIKKVSNDSMVDISMVDISMVDISMVSDSMVDISMIVQISMITYVLALLETIKSSSYDSQSSSGGGYGYTGAGTASGWFLY